MKSLLGACAFFLFLPVTFAQLSKKTLKYPSLLWEISGGGLVRPSYLFGTMHVSNKAAFHLSDSFYLSLKAAQVVALETNPGTWQEDFSRYDLEGPRALPAAGNYGSTPQEYLSIYSLQIPSFNKAVESSLYVQPYAINTYLYRNRTDGGSEFEEDTYLDLHIYQAGRKLGKKISGVEDFDGSMQLVKEAYADAAREKKKEWGFDFDEDFSLARMEEAYRAGNLDLLDTINKINSQSAAFDEKFLYQRNRIQAASIDSILKSGSRLFVGVGAAHLPGHRGVIELLRQQGYRLRPIKMSERDSHHKENIERLRVPVRFQKNVSEDGFYTVFVPGKLYPSASDGSGPQTVQYADMSNGSYYLVTRIATNAALIGLSESEVRKKMENLLYESIPGKIVSNVALVKNGYPGFDIVNRTRRGDLQRYQIFITPFEILLFKMSGNGDYIKWGTEAEQFFSSIQLTAYQSHWRLWQPAVGGFEALFPHSPLENKGSNWQYSAFDSVSKTTMAIIRLSVHNYDFLEEDSFDLNLMAESFASSDCVDTCLFRQWTRTGGYASLDCRYLFKDGTLALVRFLIQGPLYFMLITTAPSETPEMKKFINSFAIRPFVYGPALPQQDSSLYYRVSSPVALQPPTKLSLYPQDGRDEGTHPDDSLVNNGLFRSRIVTDKNTGEKVYVSYYKHSPYYFQAETDGEDAMPFQKEWNVRSQIFDTLASGLVVHTYSLGSTTSSRLLWGKEIGRDGMGYKLLSQGDTLTAPSDFVRNFFDSFTPVDDFSSMAITQKKSTLFFSQFFSADSVTVKKALKNIGAVKMDTGDFFLLKKMIGYLTWNQKGYLDIKKAAISKLASMPSAESALYLQSLYASAGDTLELQYTILKTLLQQRTKQAYQVFGAIMQSDPPVLMTNAGWPFASQKRKDRNANTDDAILDADVDDSFMEHLSDSLELTAGIFKNLLPLMNTKEYERPLLLLMEALVDTNLLPATDYDMCFPGFLLEAKQLLKKQIIREKSATIEKKKITNSQKELPSVEEQKGDNGNGELSLYSSLLRPFYTHNEQVRSLFQQMLASTNRRLKFNTATLFIRHGMNVPDSVLLFLASQDEYRYPLYKALLMGGQSERFPPQYKSQLSMAQSQLVTTQIYSRPDTLCFLQKIPLHFKDADGYVYVFKYKENKEDITWKLASAGLFPKDTAELSFSTLNKDQESVDFFEWTHTRLLPDQPLVIQVEDFVKKRLYSRRNSSSRFYEEESCGRY